MENPISFQSTRTHERGDFEETLVQGLAKDGGLYVPKAFPDSFDRDFFEKELPNMSIPEISTALLRKFIPSDEISNEKLLEMMQTAHHFDIPLEPIDDCTFVARLDQGPTASFKDIAARALAQLLEDYAEKKARSINIVVATSGDTGVAIADAFGGSKWITVTVMYPTNGVSEVQEKQMLDVAQRNSNVQALPMEGNFDDCQNIAKLLLEARELDPGKKEAIEKYRSKVKELLKKELYYEEAVTLAVVAKKLNLSSANSINIWRLIPQMTQYFVSYASLVKKGRIKAGEEIVFSVPSGNVGHLMAGIYGKEMGLPVKKFIAGTNQNNILANIIGDQVIQHEGFKPTEAPSMDILDPSNLERLLDYARQKADPEAVIDFEGIKKTIRAAEVAPIQQFGVTQKMMDFLRELIWAEDMESDKEILETMDQVSMFTNRKVVMEPHGAAGIKAINSANAAGFIDEKDIVVNFETAHPDKFPEAVKKAGLKNNRKHPRLQALESLSIEGLKKPTALNDIREVFLKVRDLAVKVSNGQ